TRVSSPPGLPLFPFPLFSSAIVTPPFSSAREFFPFSLVNRRDKPRAPPLQVHRHCYTGKYEPGSLKRLGCPLGQENRREVSTMICPSGASWTLARSIGRGAGPSKLIPSLSYPLPWQGHLNLFSLCFQ